MDRSRIDTLVHVLIDSIGPRLTGSPSYSAAAAWILGRYQTWGIRVDIEQYGTWRGWQRGITHVDLLTPRVRSLDATMLAWSPGTSGPITGPVVLLPDAPDSVAFAAALTRTRGAFVLISAPQRTCRPDESWTTYGSIDQVARMRQDRARSDSAWLDRIKRARLSTTALARAVESAGARGVLTSQWAHGWGAVRVMDARTRRAPMLSVSCEDYGLLARLAEHGDSPTIRVDAQAKDLGEVPVANVVASIPGKERANEYVMLSAHLDSWDGASGATDNGSGTLMMLEAMRILRATYPHPKRTLVAAHWGGEEEGFLGSRAFVADHPDIVQKLAVLFNQDNGTGRVTHIPMGGFLDAGPHFARWVSQLPAELRDGIQLHMPSEPAFYASDFAPFLCAGAPAFSLNSSYWNYGESTWHTNMDTYDKLVLDDVRFDATLVAMLAYLASEDPTMIDRSAKISGADEARRKASDSPACEPPVRGNTPPR